MLTLKALKERKIGNILKRAWIGESKQIGTISNGSGASYWIIVRR